MREATQIAYIFQIDPVVVLDATREEHLIRQAALLIVHDEQKKAEARRSGRR